MRKCNQNKGKMKGCSQSEGGMKEYIVRVRGK